MVPQSTVSKEIREAVRAGTYQPEDTGAGLSATEVVSLSRLHYIFSPIETFDLGTDARLFGIKRVPAGRLQLIRNKDYTEHTFADSAVAGEVESIDVTRTNYAADIAENFYSRWANTGLRVIAALTEAPVVLKNWIEYCIFGEALPRDTEGRIDPQQPFSPGFQDLRRLINAAKPALLTSDIEPYCRAFLALRNTTAEDLFEEVRAEMLSACAGAEVYLRTAIDTHQRELLDKSPNKRGLNKLTPKLRWWYDQMGWKQPDDLVAAAERDAQQRMAGAQAGDGLVRKQCRVCGELVALIDGELPEVCRYGNHDPRGKAAAAVATAEAIAQAGSEPAGLPADPGESGETTLGEPVFDDGSKPRAKRKA